MFTNDQGHDERTTDSYNAEDDDAGEAAEKVTWFFIRCGHPLCKCRRLGPYAQGGLGETAKSAIIAFKSF